MLITSAVSDCSIKATSQSHVGKSSATFLDSVLKPSQKNYLFSNVNVITMQSPDILPAMDVFIKNGKIEKINPHQASEVPGYIKIDATGKYLMPGLSDMHVHFNSGNYNRNALFLFIMNGITTARIMWGSNTHIELRDSIKAGKLLGPQLYVASAGFNGNTPLWPGTILTPTDDDLKQEVKKYADAGYDYIKVYGSLQEHQYDVLFDECKKNNIKPLGHLPNSLTLQKAISSRQYSIEHLGGFVNHFNSTYNFNPDGNEFKRMIKESKQAGIWFCPTMTVVDRSTLKVPEYKSDPNYNYLPPDWKSWYEEKIAQPITADPSAIHQMRMVVLKKLFEQKANIIGGTDMGIRYIYPGSSLHDELVYFVEAGMTPYEALITVTKNAAAFFKINDIGTIAEGSRADLLLLEANPLDNIMNTRKIDGTMVNGTWFNKSTIEKVKENLVLAY